MDYRTLAATPATLPEGDLPQSRIQVAVLADDFTDPRYGDFAITAEHVANCAAIRGAALSGQ